MKYARISEGYFYDNDEAIMNDYNRVTGNGDFPGLWDLRLIGLKKITFKDIVKSLDKVEECF